MTTQYEVGNDIVSWCTKCKLMLDHKIVALVDNFPKKAKCKTCNGHHNYRDKAPQKSTTSRKSKKSEYEILLSQVEGDDFSGAKKYSLKGNFKENQMVDHATFGIGFILSVIERNKVEILFKDGPKRLVQNR
ncbi:MAG: hypothetical protein ACE5F7_10185 [Nitrospiria bacterium]